MDDPLLPLPIGTPAPKFALPRAPYAIISLAGVRGRPAVLVFYPTVSEPVSDPAGSSARALFVLDEDGVIRWSHTCPAAITPGIGGILTAPKSMAFTRSLDRSGPVARKGESHAHCSRPPR